MSTHCRVATLCECPVIVQTHVYIIKQRKTERERRKLHVNRAFFPMFVSIGYLFLSPCQNFFPLSFLFLFLII